MIIYLIIILVTTFILMLPGVIIRDSFFNINNNNPSSNLLFFFLIGYNFFSLLSGYTSLFIPVDRIFLFCILFFFTIYLILNRISFLINFKKLKYLNKSNVIILIVISMFISFFGAIGIKNFDSFLYHVQSIKWISEFPVVPGLGNIHGRFAFNSMFFPISSLFSLNLVGQKEWLIFPLNSALFLIFLLWQYFNLKKSLKEDDRAKVLFILVMVFLPFIYLLKRVSSPTPDFPCAILGMIVLQWIVFERNNDDSNKRIIIIGTIITTITFKLSFVPMLVLIPLFLLKRNWLIDITKIFFMGILISLPFLIRNYFISGFLFYPFLKLDIFNPDWKIPDSLVKVEADYIKAWAIRPDIINTKETLEMSVFEWFPSWFMGMDHLMKILLLICVLFLISCITAFLLRKNGPDIKWVFFLGVAFLFWFVQAPDPRFIFGIIFFTVAYFVYWFTKSLIVFFPNGNFKIIILTLTLVFGFLGFTNSIYYKMSLSYKENLSQFVFPSAFYNDFEQPIIKEYESPFRYFAPDRNECCFNAPLPCATGVFKENLEMRGTTLADGFRVRKKEAN